MAAVAQVDPTLVFVEHASSGVDGAGLARAIRRSVMDCRTIPIIMVTAEATTTAICAARDAGVHEFMRKPFALKDLTKRLEVVANQPRDWVEAIRYIGPDRRRFNSEAYSGQKRRKLDDGTEEENRISRALKIIQAAARAVDDDPFQARRALNAQALALQRAGFILDDKEISEAAAELERLTGEEGQTIQSGRIEDIVRTLMSRVPRYGASQADAADPEIEVSAY